jgi:sulfatase modifying factor 1
MKFARRTMGRNVLWGLLLGTAAGYSACTTDVIVRGGWSGDAGESDAGVSDADVSDADVSDVGVSDADVSDADVSDAAETDNDAGPGECVTGEKQCLGNTVQECKNGTWEDQATCVAQTCLGEGVCTGVCAPGEKQCDDKTVQECMNGQWVPTDVCPSVCHNGSCSGPGCESLPATCGPNKDESCCATTLVPGGTYNRSNDANYPATIDSFRLDRFEITVGRFREFVKAYPGSKPAAGAGAHPLISGSGWDPAWDANLPADQGALIAEILDCSTNPPYPTWTDLPGANETLPISCISWYEAFAFCAWDGGRLPTDAEWNYAAAGGSEQRDYPWPNPNAPGPAPIDNTYAVYECTADGSAPFICAISDILSVGSKSPKGDSKWGQSDMAGSVYEWNFDCSTAYPLPCNNCAALQCTIDRVMRGGGWLYGKTSQATTNRYAGFAFAHFSGTGARCARNP